MAAETLARDAVYVLLLERANGFQAVVDRTFKRSFKIALM